MTFVEFSEIVLGFADKHRLLTGVSLCALFVLLARIVITEARKP